MPEIKEYRFDTSSILSVLEKWVNLESPTFNYQAVNNMMDLCSNHFAEMGGRIERIPGKDGLGDCLRVSFNQTSENIDKPGILIMGHMDTVHPIGTIKKIAFQDRRQ